MILILISLTISSCELAVYNSYYSKTTSISYVSCAFGNPALLTIYGRASFISAYPNYPSLPSLINAFAVFSNYQTYSIAKLSLLAQNKGAVGAAFVSQSSGWTFKSVDNDQNDEKKINIVVIKVLKADAERLMSYSGSLWLMYKYDIEQKSTSIMKLYLNGNYTQDREFVQAFVELNSKIPLQKSFFGISVNSLFSYDAEIYKDNDCMSYQNTYLCMKGTKFVNGMWKVNNAIMVLKYFDLISNLAVFFDSLINLYNFCEADYSQSCILGQLGKTSAATTADVNNYASYFTQEYSNTMCKINSNLIYWPDYLESAYCLSLNGTPSACTTCSASCSYPSLTNTYCNLACNVSSCSYDNLNCISNYGCYNFLLGDGRCDSVCRNDPDCFSTDECAPGCYYTDMKDGYCPLVCQGACFSSCSKEYCSPNCLYKDLYAGVCSIDCTSDCLLKCASSGDTCSPGCLYSDMEKGYCSVNCTGSCFSRCDSDLYCSPGCSYSALKSGSCSEDCSDKCLTQCNTDCPSYCNENYKKYKYCPKGCTSICCMKENSSSGSTGSILVYILPPILGTLVLILIVLSAFYFYKRFKPSDHVPDPNDIPLPAGALNNNHHEPPVQQSDEDVLDDLHDDIPAFQPNIPLYPILPNLVPNHNPQNNELVPLIFQRNVYILGEAICSIDLDDIRYGDAVILLPCHHIFHPMCINGWLEVPGRERRCPNCNRSLLGVHIRLK